jgi:hypothetical protein
MTIIQEHSTLVGQTTRREEVKTYQAEKKTEEVTSDEWVSMRGTQVLESNSQVLLQVNCRSILNKSLGFWNLVDTYNPDIIICTESWLRKEVSNAEVFRDDYTTFIGETGILEVVEFSFV